MNRSQFLTKLEQNGISLDESRMHEVNYYFNLWCDTCRKVGVNADFSAFIQWMKNQ